MAKNRKKEQEKIPEYGSVVKKGVHYFRTRITDADGKRVDLYAPTREELYKKEKQARLAIEDLKFRKQNPTVAEYSERWLFMHSATISWATQQNYARTIKKYITEPLGDIYMSEVTADDIKMALIPLATVSESIYSQANMLIKSIFFAAELNETITENPTDGISAKGGVAKKERDALSDEQVRTLVNAMRGLPPYLFIMIGLYAGLRREEILGLQWDCVFLDARTPYISVRRAWRIEKRKVVISTTLKTPKARRDIPIPRCLAELLREVKATSASDFVVANSAGGPLTDGQCTKLWNYVRVRTALPRTAYKVINGERIKYTLTPTLGSHQANRPSIVYSIDFHVTPHILRYTYITNLIYAGVDPKTAQYLAGHKNSKTTMEIYAKVKYNRPEKLIDAVNRAFA